MTCQLGPNFLSRTSWIFDLLRICHLMFWNVVPWCFWHRVRCWRRGCRKQCYKFPWPEILFHFPFFRIFWLTSFFMSSSMSVYLTMGNWYPAAGATSVSVILQLWSFLEWEDFRLLELCCSCGAVQTKLVGVYRYRGEGGAATEGVGRPWKIIYLVAGNEDDLLIRRYLVNGVTWLEAYLNVLRQRVSIESGRQWPSRMGWIAFAFLLSSNLLACKVTTSGETLL